MMSSQPPIAAPKLPIRRVQKASWKKTGSSTEPFAQLTAANFQPMPTSSPAVNRAAKTQEPPQKIKRQILPTTVTWSGSSCEWPVWAQTPDWNAGNNWGKGWNGKPPRRPLEDSEAQSAIESSENDSTESQNGQGIPELSFELERDLLTDIFAELNEDVAVEENRKVEAMMEALKKRVFPSTIDWVHDPDSDALENWMEVRGGVKFRWVYHNITVSYSYSCSWNWYAIFHSLRNYLCGID